MGSQVQTLHCAPLLQGNLDIPGVFAQRRSLNDTDQKPAKHIRPELPCANNFLQALIRRRQDPDV
jgi:hypothetical protein